MAMGMSRQDRIRDRAYQLWEEAGRPSGRDLEHWARAEAELRVAPPRAPAPPVVAPLPVAPLPVAMVQPPRSSGERAIVGAFLACFVLALAGIAAFATVSRLDARQALELERFKAEGQLALEQRKLEAQLLLEAAHGGDPETVARNLRFLIAAGLLDDRDHKIAGLAAAGQVPVIAPPPEPEAGNVNSRRIAENGSDFLISSRASPEGDRTIFTYRVTNNGAREETVDWGDILHATIAPGRSASIVKSAVGPARSAATFFQWGTAAKTLVYAFVPGPAGASPQDQPAP